MAPLNNFKLQLTAAVGGVGAAMLATIVYKLELSMWVTVIVGVSATVSIAVTIVLIGKQLASQHKTNLAVQNRRLALRVKVLERQSSHTSPRVGYSVRDRAVTLSPTDSLPVHGKWPDSYFTKIFFKVSRCLKFCVFLAISPCPSDATEAKYVISAYDICFVRIFFK